jgi:hypothetical protein
MIKIFLLMFSASFILSAQDYKDSITRVEDLFKSFRYEEVVSASNAILQDTSLNTETAIKLHMMKGISHFSIHQDSLAEQSFVEVLKKDVSYTPDSGTTSPVVINFFNNIKSEFIQNTTEEVIQVQDENQVPPEMQLKNYSSALRSTITRSLLFPGLGHLYLNNSTGWYFITGAGLTVMSSVYFALRTADKRSEYLEQREPAEIAAKYDEYNSSYKMRNISLILFGTIWLYSQIEILSMDSTELILTTSPGKNSSLTFKFNL